MNAAVKPFGRKLKTSTLWILASLGLVIFVLLQVLPTTVSESLQVEQTKNIISKDEAKQSAVNFMESTLGISGNLNETLVTYETYSEVYGYLSRKN